MQAPGARSAEKSRGFGGCFQEGKETCKTLSIQHHVNSLFVLKYWQRRTPDKMTSGTSQKQQNDYCSQLSTPGVVTLSCTQSSRAFIAQGWLNTFFA